MPKLSVEDQIQARIESFASELSELVRQAALEAVEGALSGTSGGAATAPGKKKVGRPKGSGKGTRKATRKKRARQSSAAIEKLSGQILAYVKSNKGSRLEEISRGLGTPSAELKASVKGLLADGKLRKTGAKRGTKYFAKSK